MQEGQHGLEWHITLTHLKLALQTRNGTTMLFETSHNGTSGAAVPSAPVRSWDRERPLLAAAPFLPAEPVLWDKTVLSCTGTSLLPFPCRVTCTGCWRVVQYGGNEGCPFLQTDETCCGMLMHGAAQTSSSSLKTCEIQVLLSEMGQQVLTTQPCIVVWGGPSHATGGMPGCPAGHPLIDNIDFIFHSARFCAQRGEEVPEVPAFDTNLVLVLVLVGGGSSRHLIILTMY